MSYVHMHICAFAFAYAYVYVICYMLYIYDARPTYGVYSRIRPVGDKRPLERFPLVGPCATPRAPSYHVQHQLLTYLLCSTCFAILTASQGGALTTSDFGELSARLSSLAIEVPACRGRVLSVLEGTPTTAVLSMAILTLAILTMAILSIAILSRGSKVSEQVREGGRE